MKSYRAFRSKLISWLIPGLILLTALLLSLSSVEPSQARSSGLQAAWERAREAGSYHFVADITQTTIPLLTVTNVGRQSREDRLHIEGQTNLPERALDLTVWTDGGSVINGQDGIEVRIEDDRALARQAGGPWEEINDFSGLFAPDGDLLAYLAAVENVVEHGVETRAGHTFTRYDFGVDGPGLAEYLRDQLEHHLAEQGELPIGATLDVPRQVADITGEGELWVGQDGLPLRQIVHLQFPDGHDASVQAEINVTFSEFGAGTTPPRDWLSSHRRLLQEILLFLLAAALIGTVVVYRRSKKMYAALALALISSLVFTPVLQGAQMAAFSEGQVARERERERQVQESQMQEALADLQASQQPNGPSGLEALAMIQSDDGIDSDRDGLTDVQEAFLGSDPAQADAYTTLSSLGQAPLLEENGEDSDGDGLTDYQEQLLGTLPNLADTDGDGITDTLEIQGFTYDSQLWTTDPLEPDTNQDGLGDDREWFLDADGDGMPDDTDNDGVPDLLDTDNDGDGVPDRLDLSKYQTTLSGTVTTTGTHIYTDAGIYDRENPFSLILDVDETNAGIITYVEFQLRPINPNHLWYAYNVLDWPDGDRQAHIQDDDGATFYDLCWDSALAEGRDPTRECALSPDDNGDVKLVPMLEIVIPGSPDNLPDPTILHNYGIAVQPLPEGAQAAYVPLQLVTQDRGRQHVAFSTKMLYLPQMNWGEAHQVRLVWAVQVLVDMCIDYQDGECSEYGERNQVQLVHSYYDTWYLTGLNVREDHGADVAIIYEDPAVDGDLNDDSVLWSLTPQMDVTFIGRQPFTRTNGTLAQDISVDLLYNDLNHTTNGGGITSTWAITNILSVVTHTYTHRDEALITIAITDSLAILDNTFTPYRINVGPITPTLMFAREERYRSVNLDEGLLGSSLLSWQGNQLTVAIDPDRVSRETMASLAWGPYNYNGSSWNDLAIDVYWEELGNRLTDELDDPDPDVALGQLTVAQIYYAVLYQGMVGIVQTDDQLVHRGDLNPSNAVGVSLLRFGASAVRFILNRLFLSIYWKRRAFTGVAKVIAGQRFTSRGWADPLRTTWRFLKGLVRQGLGGLVVVTVAGLLVGAYFLAKAFLANDPRARIAVAVIVGSILTYVSVIAPILRSIDFSMAMAKILGISKLVALSKTLTAHCEIAGASSIASAVVTIILIGISWGVFIWTVTNEDLPGPALKTLLVQTIVSTVFYVLLFLLSLTVIGAIIVALFFLIDFIATLCGFSIFQWFVESITPFFYNYEVVANPGMEMGGLDMALVEPQAGMVGGSQMEVSTVVTTTITSTVGSCDPLGRYLEWEGFYSDANLLRTNFAHALGPTARDIQVSPQGVAWQMQRPSCVGADQRRIASSPIATTGQITLTAGINARPALYLNTSYWIHAEECVLLFICWDTPLQDSVSTDLANAIVLDILPSTLDEFYALAWGGHTFENQMDHDGDGLLSKGFNGNDPDDETWDADHDGLSDAYELEIRSLGIANGGARISPVADDSDVDGLCDDQEIRYGTAPDRRDTDGDGLLDGEEIFHQDRCDYDQDGDTDEWIGGWTFTYGVISDTHGTYTLTTRIQSDPLHTDWDGDGMDDLAEKTLHEMDPLAYAFHPTVYNESPVAIYVELGDEDRVVAPGQNVPYTATVQNNLTTGLFALGGLTVTVPGPLGARVLTSTIDTMYREEAVVVRTTLTPAVGSHNVVISSAADVLLHNGDLNWYWGWDPPARQTVQTLNDGWPYHTAIAPTNITTTEDYAVALVEGDIQDPYPWCSGIDCLVAAPYIAGTARFRHATGNFSGPTEVMSDTAAPVVGDSPADVACADDGICLIAWSDPYLYRCSYITFHRMYCHEEGDWGDYGEYVVSLGGAAILGPYELEEGDTRIINQTFSFCGPTTIEVWEDDPEDNDTLGTTPIAATSPGYEDHYFEGSGDWGDPDNDKISLDWTIHPNYWYHIHGAVISPTGAVTVADFLISSPSGEDYSTSPTVASDGTDFMVGWQALSNITDWKAPATGTWRIWTSSVSRAGQLGTMEQLTPAWLTHDNVNPDLTWAGSDYLAVWEYEYSPTDTDLWLRYLNEAPGALVTSYVDEAMPSVAYDPDDDALLIVYVRDHNTVQARTGQGHSLGHPVVIDDHSGTPGYLAHPTAAYDATNDNWLVVWGEESSPGGGIHTVNYRPFEVDGGLTPRLPRSSFAFPHTTPSLDAACSSESIVPNCAVVANSEPPHAETDPSQLYLERVYLHLAPPWLGSISQHSNLGVTVDDDLPTSTVTSLSGGQYLNTVGTLTIGGESGDPTSNITQVEVRIGTGSWELASGTESWVYNWTVPATEGMHTIETSATDSVGHQESPPSSITVTLDTTPPAPTSAIAPHAILSSTLGSDGRWAVSLNGTASDPLAGSMVGSGVAAVEVLMTPNGSGWQTATLAGNSWSIEYRLSSFNQNGALLPDPTGFYTCSVRATDNLGNRTADGSFLEVPIRIDNTPPVAEMTYADPFTAAITSTLTLQGVITDPGSVAAGTGRLEISFTPSEEGTPTNWATATLTSPGSTVSGWTHPLPELEGFYSINLRGTDSIGNRNDAMGTWHKWDGEIDTRYPRVAITATHWAVGYAAQTVYQGVAEDLNLTEDGFQFPCPVQGADRQYYASPWWNTVTSDTTRLFQLTPSCIINGHDQITPTIRACDEYSRCTAVSTTFQVHTPPLYSTILTPDHESALTSLGSITVTGGAYALGELDVLTATASGAVFHTQSWGAGITDTLWYGTWNPPGEGEYTLASVVEDRTGNVQTQTQPISITVDFLPPSLSIDPTVLTTAHRLYAFTVVLGGIASDTMGLETVDVNVNGQGWDNASFEGSTWRYPWSLGEEPDGKTYTVSVRAADLGWVTRVTETVTVDLVAPAPVTVTLSYTDSWGVRRAIERGDTIRDPLSPTLTVTWTASSDGSGLGDYLVGWSESPTPTLSASSHYSPTAARHHEHIAGEAQVLYAHLGAQDVHANQRWQTFGPIYVDTPNTPDFVSMDAELGGRPYHGWMNSGCTQIGADREMYRNAPVGGSLNEVQEFYATWDSEALRLTWTGANWDSEGDLFIYLDTGPGGAMSAHNPYSDTAPVITLPAQGGEQLQADYLIWVEDSAAAWLLEWTGSSWITQTLLGPENYKLDNDGSPPYTDLLIPFDSSGLGIDPTTTSLKLVALASEEDALRIWATVPEKNPLNSSRVVNPVALGYLRQPFALTQYVEWNSLSPGVCPNEGRFDSSDIRVDLTADPPGVEVGFLEHDLPALLGPNQPLDADLDGDPDPALPLPLDIAPGLVGDDEVLTYTLSFANEGTAIAQGVVVTLTARGAVRFAGGDDTLVVDIGYVNAGFTATVEFTATVDTALDGESGEVIAEVADRPHGAFDWLWVQHDVDTSGPEDLAIVWPRVYVSAYTNTVRGTVSDPSGVPSVTLQARGSPTVTIDCPDSSPEDGQWACLWNAGGAPDGTQFGLRVRAADSFGNLSNWTEWLTVTVDTIPPTVDLSADTLTALVDDLIGPDEMALTGVVVDDRQASAVEVCAVPLGEPEQNCEQTPVTPGDTAVGDWYVPSPVLGHGDGSWQTVFFYGVDSVGNRSTAPLSRTFRVDVVPPAVTVHQLTDLAIQLIPEPVFTGTVSDGGGVDRVDVRIVHPDLSATWEGADLSGEDWSHTTSFGAGGGHALGVEAWDAAGNVRLVGPFDLWVLEVVSTLHMPVVMRGYAAPCYDDYEPDDEPWQAREIATDGTGQEHDFHQPGDVDWVAFYVPDPGTSYVIETFDLHPSADTVIYLFDSDQKLLLDWNDDAGPGIPASYLYLNPYHAGWFYLRVVQYNPQVGACGIDYSIRVSAQP